MYVSDWRGFTVLVFCVSSYRDVHWCMYVCCTCVSVHGLACGCFMLSRRMSTCFIKWFHLVVYLPSCIVWGTHIN